MGCRRFGLYLACVVFAAMTLCAFLVPLDGTRFSQMTSASTAAESVRVAVVGGMEAAQSRNAVLDDGAPASGDQHGSRRRRRRKPLETDVEASYPSDGDQDKKSNRMVVKDDQHEGSQDRRSSRIHAAASHDQDGRQNRKASKTIDSKDQRDSSRSRKGGKTADRDGADGKIKIYVYDICVNTTAIRDGESGVSRGSQCHIDVDWKRIGWHDAAYNELIRRSPLRTEDPSKADWFYIPVEARSWMNNALDFKTHECPLCRQIDERVVEMLRKFGPYWDTLHSRHIIPGSRCPAKSGNVPSDSHFFPKLFGGKVLSLCVNAERNTIDHSRALQTIYYVRESYNRPSAKHRDVLAAFMGAVLGKHNPWWFLRRVLLDGMNQCADCSGIELDSHMKWPKQKTWDTWYDSLGRAKFSIIPPGDTLERAARDQSIAMEAVPVYFDFQSGQQQSLPMSPPLRWGDFSVNFTLLPSEWPGIQGKPASFWPRLEYTLRQLVSTGGYDRLHQGVLKAKKRLAWTQTGVMSILETMLANRHGSSAHKPT